MVVHDFDVKRVALRPDKTDSEPIVNPDAVLTIAISLQGLQPVSRQRRKIAQVACLVELHEFAAAKSFDGLKPSRGMIVERSFGFVPTRWNSLIRKHPVALSCRIIQLCRVILLSLFAVRAAEAQFAANVTVTSSAATATLGSAVTFTATVVPVQATGKITFYAAPTSWARERYRAVRRF
jgi:uncharacterized protein YjdB